MKNLNLKLIMSVHPARKSFTLEGNTYNDVIYSIFATDLNYNIDYASMVRRLTYFNCEKLFIFNIEPFAELKTTVLNNRLPYMPISKTDPFFILHTMSITYFFKNNILFDILFEEDEKFDKEPIYKNSILIFNQIPLPIILALCKLNKHILTGGPSTKRSLLSIVELRLSQFLTCVEGMNKTTIFNSLHKYDKLAVQPTWDHKSINPSKTVLNLTHFYADLEKWFKDKIGDENAVMSLKKSEYQNTSTGELLDYNEFLKIYNEHSSNNKNIKQSCENNE